MIKFKMTSKIEKEYPYADAIMAADTANGTFGTVSSGTFTKGAGTVALVDVERGDDAFTDDYVVPAGAHGRVCDFAKQDGAKVQITSQSYTGSSIAVGDTLIPNSSGILEEGEATTLGFTVTALYDDYLEATVTIPTT